MTARLFGIIFSLIAFPLLADHHAISSPSNDKPIIGINMAVSERENSSRVSLSAGDVYIDAVTEAGGIPVVLPPVSTDDAIAAYVDMVDGFVFVGGPDINPSRYGQEPHETWNPIPERRETFDFMLMENALESGKPLLGVCLGMQELAVQTGGDMIQDIPSQTESDINHRPGLPGAEDAHDVTITPGTKLHQLIGTDRVSVNSMHHQACATPGPGVIVGARSPDGIIEAIEIPDHPFAIGVQWHPEHQIMREYQLSIFEGLINEARRQKSESIKEMMEEPVKEEALSQVN